MNYLFILNLLYIYFLYYIYLYFSTIFYSRCNTIILITIFSCNRFNYLNRTVNAFYKHLYLYEKNLKYNTVYIDQGTIQRNFIVEKFHILNRVYMNPIGYELSFNVIFSYLYTKYILLLEEDWEVVKDIEKQILYPSFIAESIYILDIIKLIYGILLRNIPDINVNYSINVVTSMGKHLLNVLKPQKNRFTFTNGASIYRSSDIKHLKYYINEYSTSQYFKHNNYKMGFTYKGLKGLINSSNSQFVMKHIGKKTTRNGICNIWLY